MRTESRLGRVVHDPNPSPPSSRACRCAHRARSGDRADRAPCASAPAGGCDDRASEMSLRYLAVNWNRQKRIYDLTLAASVVGLVVVFAVTTFAAHPTATIESAVIRGLGLTAFLLLHVILLIGPLARLDSRFLPLLYNRRHL